MNPKRVLPLLAAATALAAPAAASASELLDRTVTAPVAAAGSCLQERTGAGVVRHAVTTTATGLVRATLRGDERSDWDVAIFRGGNRIAGSSNFGSTELAEGVAAAGTDLVVQACRRSGSAASVDLEVIDIALDEPEGTFLKLARVRLPNQHARDVFATLDLDSTEHGEPNGFMDVLLHGPADIDMLTTSGLRWEILLDDAVGADRRALADFSRELRDAPEPLPSGRVTYRTYEEYGEEMKALVAENPGLVRPVTLRHRTLEGRPVEGVEITSNVDQPNGKPVFLMTGVHHAREWPSGELSMEWAYEAVTKFRAGNERMKKLLENVRLVVVPLVNPDGFVLSRMAPVDAQQPIYDPGFAYKRKNCRIKNFELPQPGECAQQANRYLGVDPNRNYGGDWGGPGASSAGDNDTYRGPAPFSEPETQNILDFISTNQVQTFITNHTYSDLILRPPAAAEDPDTPDEAAYKAFSDAMAAENGYASLKSYELYDTSGSAEGWSYYATGGYGFTFEIGRANNAEDPVYVGNVAGVGFHPPYPTVIAEWNGKYGGGGNREAFYIAAEHTMDPRNHAVLEGTGPAGATIRLKKEFVTVTKGRNEDESRISRVDRLDTSTTIPAAGTFSYHVNQSTRPAAVALGQSESWTLTCEYNGRVLGTQSVSVARGETKRLGDVCPQAGGASQGATPADGFALSVKGRKLSLTKFLRRGVGVAATCSATCDLRARIGVTRKVARKLKLGRKVRRIASRTRKGASGRTVLRFKPSKKIARKLRRAKKFTAALRVTATSGAAKRTAKVTLKFQR